MRRPRRYPGRATATARGLLPSTEVYTVLRENGFSPLGIPRLRGFVYTIAVIDRGGEDGRLVIDARNGRIIRFVPAYRMGDNFDEEPETHLRSSAAAAMPGQPRRSAGPGPGRTAVPVQSRRRVASRSR